MNESPSRLPAPEAPEARERDAAVAKRLARLEWKARSAGEFRDVSQRAGMARMAGEYARMEAEALAGLAAQRAWADAAARWDAAGADTSFLGGLDPAALAALPDAAFDEVRRKRPDVAVPGRAAAGAPAEPAAPAPISRTPSAAPAHFPAAPVLTAETTDEPAQPAARTPAPFSTVPVLAPEKPVRPQAKGPAWETPASAPKTAERSTGAVPRAPALPEKSRAALARPSAESARPRVGPAPADIIDYDIRRLAKGARFSGADVAASAARHGVPPELLAAFLRNDSRYGTRGHGASNNNPGNVGQYDRLKKPVRGYATPQDGLDAAAENLARRMGAYRDATGRDDWTARELATGRTRDGQRFYGAYMTDKNGPANVEKIYAQLATADIKGAPWNKPGSRDVA